MKKLIGLLMLCAVSYAGDYDNVSGEYFIPVDALTNVLISGDALKTDAQPFYVSRVITYNKDFYLILISTNPDTQKIASAKNNYYTRIETKYLIGLSDSWVSKLTTLKTYAGDIWSVDVTLHK